MLRHFVGSPNMQNLGLGFILNTTLKFVLEVITGHAFLHKMVERFLRTQNKCNGLRKKKPTPNNISSLSILFCLLTEYIPPQVANEFIVILLGLCFGQQYAFSRPVLVDFEFVGPQLIGGVYVFPRYLGYDSFY